eukprot:TRINITY_DN9341_c0_g1_i2.p1 TRINITY_DN9341_c0_g1~~TRINITY_DN9341_c0_g1_i2.p1  ORF type:complete len:278 (+),score=54.92 TRINITY_DN9341_c0_g1_i2:320-1153(+)
MAAASAVQGGSGEWIRFPHLSGPCRTMMEDIAQSIDKHLSALICPTRTPSNVTNFVSPRGNSEGSFVLRSGTDTSQVRFVFGSWIHCKLAVGTLNAATLFVMLGPGNDAPHFMFEVIQNDSTNFILLLDLLPRKDLVSNPDYLKTYYEDTGLEKCRQLVEKSPQSQSYMPTSLYVRSAVSPTALLFKFKDIQSSGDLNVLIEEVIHPTAREVFCTWVDVYNGRSLGRPHSLEEESAIFERDEQIWSIGIEKDMSSNLPKLFGQEIADRVIAAIRKGE